MDGDPRWRRGRGLDVRPGGGEVTETEIGDDGAAYEVEITLADGSQVEVNLDEDFVVTGSTPDDDSSDGDEDDD